MLTCPGRSWFSLGPPENPGCRYEVVDEADSEVDDEVMTEVMMSVMDEDILYV
jgi:hypothetical protein